jgi:ATP diphosphatase
MNPSDNSSFANLVAIMARLRAPGGCPWDREQTHESILSCLIEEAYEFVDAVERRDFPNMREELGDLLLQVVFHAEMAREAGTFDVEGVIRDISEKLVRRHPHVFGESTAPSKITSAEAVTVQWDAIKEAEKAGKKKDAEARGALGEIPRHLPALLKALKISKRAVKVGFEWPDWREVSAKVREELAEFEAEAEAGDKDARRDALEMELGDLLFSVVNLGRIHGLDPERALARSNAKFVGRFRAMEKMAEEEGAPFEGRTLESQEALWTRVKAGEKSRASGLGA